jgi:hypothetical protein
MFSRAVPHLALERSRALSTRRVSHNNGVTVFPFVICGNSTVRVLAELCGKTENAWTMFVHLPRFRRSQ